MPWGSTYFVPDQIIVTGPKQLVFEVITEVNEKLGSPSVPCLQMQEPLLLDSIDEVVQECKGPSKALISLLSSRSPCTGHGKWVMYLYLIKGGVSVQRAVTEVNEASAHYNHCVRADPNYLIGYPHIAAGSPYNPANNAGTMCGGGNFKSQWAFGHIGLVTPGQPAIQHKGQGVRVGVFDTSPFPNECTSLVNWISPALTLQVKHPPLYELLPVPSSPSTSSQNDLSYHGYSVAGLVHSVAPNSTIQLYRVLNERVQGNLFVLAAAILEFVGGVPSNSGVPDGGVINLSLGVLQPPRRGSHGFPKEVMALEIVLAYAHCRGFVIVAAAGNEGNGSFAQIPAAYPYVIGVGASNRQGEHACFSNKGDVYAPGGDGAGNCSSPFGNSSEAWKYTLVSISPKLTRQATGFRRCLGTSFAAPLVSGQAALILGKNGPMSASKVAEAIANSAVQQVVGGKHIIHLPTSLQP